MGKCTTISLICGKIAGKKMFYVLRFALLMCWVLCFRFWVINVKRFAFYVMRCVSGDSCSL